MENTKQKNRLSDHFSLEELSYSRIAIENGIDNTPEPGVRRSLEHLVLYLLEPLRRLYGNLKFSGKNRMQVLLYIYCLILLLPGCGISRKRQKQDRMFRSDTIVTSTLQSSRLKRSSYLNDSAIWHICQVVYSTPDSMGRLFPETVTSMKVEHHRLLTDSCQSEQASKNQYTRQQIETSLAGSSSVSVQRNRYVFLFCGILFVVAILYFHNRKV